MRCPECHSYIPEGLSDPAQCPQCGRTASAPVPPARAEARGAPEAPDSPAGPPPLPGATPPSSSASGTDELFSAEPTPEPASPGPSPNPRSRLGLQTPAATPATESSGAFAPYFSIKLRLAYSPAAAGTELRNPTEGSVSFGPDGFSIVFDDGLHWEKLLYRDVKSVRAHDDSVVVTHGTTESRLTIYHDWLPTWLAGPRRARAAVFVELLSRVKNGLTPYEVSLFRRRLQ
ncbi:MAG: hypothetical protein HY075_11285 [Deltaproteobacteria bacterium]|nr:hypothetical protein [Deltaproteobacteria bacterium]